MRQEVGKVRSLPSSPHVYDVFMCDPLREKGPFVPEKNFAFLHRLYNVHYCYWIPVARCYFRIFTPRNFTVRARLTARGRSGGNDATASSTKVAERPCFCQTVGK